MPRFDDLALVLDAATDANFGTTARRRHVSQSTVSRAVGRVEGALGITLFERAGRQVRLTPPAPPALAELRRIVDAWTALTAGHVAAGAAPPLTVYCTVTASQSIVPGLLRTFRHDHPDVVLSLRTGPASAAIDAVRDGSADAAIALLPERLARPLVSLDLAAAPLVAVAADECSDWSDARIVLPRQGLVRSSALRWCRAALGRGWEVEDADGHEEVLALAALGTGIGIVPQLVLDVSVLRATLRVLPPPAPLPVLRLGLCARRSAASSEPLASLWRLAAAR